MRSFLGFPLSIQATFRNTLVWPNLRNVCCTRKILNVNEKMNFNLCVDILKFSIKHFKCSRLNNSGAAKTIICRRRANPALMAATAGAGAVAGAAATTTMTAAAATATTTAAAGATTAAAATTTATTRVLFHLRLSSFSNCRRRRASI